MNQETSAPMQFKFQFTVSRIFLGTLLASLPLAVFGQFGGDGIVIGSIIALALLAICLVADKDRLDWAFGVFMFAGAGFGISAMFPPVGRIEDMQNQFAVCTLMGAIIGYIVCEWNLRRKQDKS